MIKRKVHFTLDCSKPGSQFTVEGLHVGDKRSCELHILLRNGIIPLIFDDENIAVIMNAQKPDGTTISALCDVSADKKEALYTLDEQDTAVAGIVGYELIVAGYDGENYRILYSAIFSAVVSAGVIVPVFKKLETQPEDWATDYKKYFRKTVNGYEKITDNTCPAFNSDDFYFLINPNYDSENDYAAFEKTVANVQNLTVRMNTVEADKADKTYVDSQNAAQDAVTATKADKTYVDNQNAAQNSAIEGKADKATTLAGYGITDGMRFVIVPNDESVDDCTEKNTLYQVKFASGIVATSTSHVICVHSENKLMQYAFTRGGYILFRGKHTGGDWTDWDYLTTREKVAEMINSITIPTKTSQLTNDSGFLTDNNTVAAFDSENDEVIKYMSAEPQTDSEYAYSNVNTSLSERKDIPGAFSVTLPAGTACLRIVDCQSGDEWKETAGAGEYEIRNLIPGRIYRYYALKANGTILDSGSCTGRGQVRMIDVPKANGERNVFNIRDLGGWACSGGVMKYGLVFRGGRLNGSNPGVSGSAIELTEQQIAYFKNVLHIADEIDLRTSNEINKDGISGSALGEAVSWINKTLGYYQNSLTDSTSANYAVLINRLAENLAAGKVTYIHCNSGADRTAQLCMFIEAICGVRLIDMERDYELTSYAFEYRSGQIDRRRNKITGACWKTLMQALDSETGSTIQEKAVSFLLRKGVTSSAISTIREKLVENSGGNTDISGKADKATTLAGYGITDAYTKEESDVRFFEFLDGAFTGDPYINPTLLVNNTIDATYNPNGHYILYYIDSDGGRHNLFDFTYLPFLTQHQDISGKFDKSKIVKRAREQGELAEDTVFSTQAIYDYVSNLFNTYNLEVIDLIKIWGDCVFADSQYASFVYQMFKIDNTVDQTYNPNGHYILYYIDSDNVRHNLFDLSQYFAEKAAVPTKTSQLTNDSGFITARDVPYVTPQQFGAKGDGVHDDTEAINACFASGASNVYFPKGAYLVDAHHDGFTHETEGGLRPQSNCVITLDADATIKCSTSPTDFYNILHFVNVSNVIVQGGKIVGDKATHVQVSQPTYEFGHGVGIQNSTNIVVRDMEISDCIGDGVILNVSGNADITLDNLTIHDCRRQGISLTSGDGITISNCKIYDISGANPQSGIDIEPDGEKSVTNVVIDSCDIHDTVGASVIVTNVANVIDQIHINGCLFDHALFLGGSNVTMSGGKSKKVSVKSDKAPIISACSIEEVAVSGGNSAFVGCNFASSGKDQFLTVTSDVVSGNPAESIVFTDCDFNIVNCTHFVFMSANAVDRVKLLKFSDCRAKITHALTSTYAASGFSNVMPSKTVISGCEFEFTAKTYQLFTTKPGTTNVVEITDSSIVNSNSDRTVYFISGNAAYDVWIENSTLSNYVNMLYGGGDTTTGEIVLLNDRFVDFPRPDGKSDADNVTITNITRDNTKYLSGAKSNIQAQLDAKSNFSGSYNDLTDKPTIPSKTSELTNDSGFLTSHQSLANYYNKTEVNSLLNGKANASHTHSQYLTSADIANKADKSEIPDISGKADSSSVYTRSQLSEKNLVITDGSQTTTYKILVVI